jgi:hypothetical protein
MNLAYNGLITFSRGEFGVGNYNVTATASEAGHPFIYYRDFGLPPSLGSSSRFPSLEDWLVSAFVQMSVIQATETSERLLGKPGATTT